MKKQSKEQDREQIKITIEPVIEYYLLCGYEVKLGKHTLCETRGEDKRDALFIQRCIAGMQNYGYDLREMWKQGVGK